MTDAQQPASWHPDPTGRHQYRYWNGAEWTDQVADDQVTATDAPIMPGSGTAPATGPAAAAPTVPAAQPGAPAAAPAAAPAPKRRGNPAGAWIAVVGALALAVGAFLDAVTANLGTSGLSVEVSKNYIDGDGPLELGIGIVIGIVALLVVFGVLPRWGGWLIFGLGALGAVVAVADIFDVKDTIDQVERFGGTASIGPALWACLGGGLLAVVGGLVIFLAAPQTDAAASPAS